MRIERVMRLALCAAVAAGLLPCLAEGGFVRLDNPGFEAANPSQGWRVPKAWRIEDGAGRKGSHGLVWENTDRGHYSFPSYELSFEPGMAYRFGAWVKVDSHSGSKLKVEVDWSDKAGKYLGYSPAFPVMNNDAGTDGWVKYEGITDPVPQNVGPVGHILCCLPKGSAGRVRFDDFYIEPVGIRWVDYLASSAYHDEAARGDGEIRFVASLYVNTVRCPLAEAVAELDYRAADGAVRTVRPRRFTESLAEFAVDASAFALGTQEVVFRLKKGEDLLGEERLRFTCTEKPIVRRVAFDREGRVSVGGKRIFPLGMYIRSLDGERLATYLKGPFNCAVQYGKLSRADLDRYAAHDLLVMMDVRGYIDGYNHGTPCLVKSQEESCAAFRRIVSEYGNHPALLGWYIVDEAPRKFHRKITEANRFLHEIDPNHPTYAVMNVPEIIRSLLPGFDVIGVDPYPIGNFWRKAEDISVCSRWPEQTRKETLGMRPMWNVPQAFNWEWYRNHNANEARTRMPSFAEMANMNWQSVAAGANGLVLYSFEPLCKHLEGAEFDRAWGDVCRAAEEVKRMEPVLLGDPSAAVAGAIPDSLVVRAFRHEGADWVLVVNRTAEPTKAKLALARPCAGIRTVLGGGVRLSDAKGLEVDFAGLGYAFVRLAE